MSHVITHRSDLLPLFDRAVASGRVCAFCGGPLSLPCIFHCYPLTITIADHPIYLHPSCAAELTVFLSADVKEVLCASNSHLGIKAAPHVSHPSHPEAR